ncbi:MAG: hypothetical protein HXY34_00955 [Candidatus Thorarchaeota archaeon]|nr:hypothetical protein [Candidatus Thorarchaeota archaeon]
MRVLSEAAEVIERHTMRFLCAERTCTFKESVPGLRVCGKSIGPFQSKTEAKLPNWVIEVLIRHGMAEVVPAEAI